MENPEINKLNEENNNKKCYSCGKIFPAPKDLQRHKNRKTPCLIREVPADQVMNPRRCIFCNRIFSTMGNLTTHLTKCKIKNGGMKILDDKVKYEQEIRILKEHIEKDRKQKDEEMRIMNGKIEKLENIITNGLTNNTVNNTTINQTINITINNDYRKPDVDHLIDNENINECVLANTFKQKILMTPMETIKLLWFDPKINKNHSIYPANARGDLLISINGEWSRDNIYEGLGKDIRDVAYAIIEILFNHVDFKPTFPNANEYVKRVKNYRHDLTFIKDDCDRILKIIMENKGMISANIVSQLKQYANDDTKAWVQQEQKKKLRV